jgi:hypothetical protein
MEMQLRKELREEEKSSKRETTNQPKAIFIAIFRRKTELFI